MSHDRCHTHQCDREVVSFPDYIYEPLGAKQLVCMAEYSIGLNNLSPNIGSAEICNCILYSRLYNVHKAPVQCYRLG